ncbi:MOSC domain-containing protein [Planctomycetota bacterium]
MPEFEILSVNISESKGTVKKPVPELRLRIDHGVEGDAHAGDWHRQVSLLGDESIDKMRAKGLELKPGDFAENITTRGVELFGLPVGTIITIGECELEVTQIGKECHAGCEIAKKVGSCVMPKEGIFAKVLIEGTISAEDRGHYNI